MDYIEPTESLIDYAYQEIKDRIQNGIYPPGTKLVTQEISNSLGVSRTPVVAAINRLVAQGLAKAIPRRGTIVAQLSIQQIKDIIEVRKMIELYSIKSAIKNLDYYMDIVDKMQSIIVKISEQDKLDYPIASKLETEFHTCFVSLTGNEQLVKIYETNWSVGAMFYLYSITKMPLSHHEKAFKHHQNIMKFLLAKDEENLRNALMEHLTIVDDTFEVYCRNAASNI